MYLLIGSGSSLEQNPASGMCTPSSCLCERSMERFYFAPIHAEMEKTNLVFKKIKVGVLVIFFPFSYPLEDFFSEFNRTIFKLSSEKFSSSKIFINLGTSLSLS